MLASEFFNERVRLRGQGKLPPGDPIVYDAKDTPQNRARFKAFNEYVLHYGQKLEDNLTKSNRLESPDEEDRGDCEASNSNSQSTGIESHGVGGGDHSSIKRRLISYTQDGKRIGNASTAIVDRYEDCIDQAAAAFGRDENESDTIVVDCGEVTEEQLTARRRSNTRQPTARQIQQQLVKASLKRKSE